MRVHCFLTYRLFWSPGISAYIAPQFPVFQGLDKCLYTANNVLRVDHNMFAVHRPAWSQESRILKQLQRWQWQTYFHTILRAANARSDTGCGVIVILKKSIFACFRPLITLENNHRPRDCNQLVCGLFIGNTNNPRPVWLVSCLSINVHTKAYNRSSWKIHQKTHRNI